MTDMKRWTKLQKLRALSQPKSAAPLAGMRWPMLDILYRIGDHYEHS